MKGGGSVFAGGAIAGLGGCLALVAFLQPQGLRVPPAVLYFCALGFLLAGAILVTRARGRRLLQAWLPVFMLACMVAPAVWLGFGSGRRRCTLDAVQSLVRLFGSRSDLACRVGFGVAAVIGACLVLLAMRQAVRSSRNPGAE